MAQHRDGFDAAAPAASDYFCGCSQHTKDSTKTVCNTRINTSITRSTSAMTTTATSTCCAAAAAAAAATTTTTTTTTTRRQPDPVTPQFPFDPPDCLVDPTNCTSRAVSMFVDTIHLPGFPSDAVGWGFLSQKCPTRWWFLLDRACLL